MRGQAMQGMNSRANVNTVARPEYPLHIQMLFTARPPLPYLKPPIKPRCRNLDALTSGTVNYLDRFEEEMDEPLPYEAPKSKKQKQKEILLVKLRAHQTENIEQLKTWNPHENKEATQDPAKTLFVSRLSYTAREKHLKREFEMYGPVKKVRIIKDKKNEKSRGYAFIEFESKRDMNAAYKEADGMKVDNRRIQVDYERARINKEWIPKRLGGGKGKTRLNKEIDDLLDQEFKKLRVQYFQPEARKRSRSRSQEKKNEKKEKKEKKDKDSKKDKDHKKEKQNFQSRKKDKKKRDHSNPRESRRENSNPRESRRENSNHRESRRENSHHRDQKKEEGEFIKQQ